MKRKTLKEKLSDEVKKVFDEFNVEYDEELNDVEVKFDTSKGKFSVKINGNERLLRPGKLFKLIKAKIENRELKDYEIAKLIAKLQVYTYKIMDDVHDNYCLVDSCQKNVEFTKFYDNFDDIKLVLLYQGNKTVGRALLWLNIDGLDRPYLDRMYPSGEDFAEVEFKKIAITNNWYYRGDQEINEYEIIGFDNNLESKKISYIFNKDEMKYDIAPYIDTFRYGYWESNDIFKMCNYETNDSICEYKFNEYTSGIKILNTWKRGTWKNGTWERGIWQDGMWKSGVWRDGTWEGGIWERGIWQDGTWEEGIWWNGTWEEGCWKGGTWKSGVWWDGTWEGGTWEKGIWVDGTWEGGIWETGIWKSGIWEDGVWKNGLWEDGVWKSGWIYDPDKVGMYEEDWKWDDECVLSYISPKEYFGY